MFVEGYCFLDGFCGVFDLIFVEYLIWFLWSIWSDFCRVFDLIFVEYLIWFVWSIWSDSCGVFDLIFGKSKNVIQMTISRSENEKTALFSLIYVARCSNSHFGEVEKCHPNGNFKVWKRENRTIGCSMRKTTQLFFEISSNIFEIHNTFLKMRLVSSMGILSVFVKNVVEIGPNYGENGSSRFQNWIYHSENSKNTFFYTFFDTAKIENLDFRPFDEYANSLKTPYEVIL